MNGDISGEERKQRARGSAPYQSPLRAGPGGGVLGNWEERLADNKIENCLEAAGAKARGRGGAPQIGPDSDSSKIEVDPDWLEVSRAQLENLEVNLSPKQVKELMLCQKLF
ncbi:hypothetical protein DSO57_1026294 [Entomophthora muscae]|uniref:Uncharacterized protein n=1 Tax=Entomophthora muscae TaxID=34485 RepID=A0ACC2T200_9FUNG|nr:hypothetical protein DSO57_1026294 [Entomophthora muscae]